MIEKSTVKSHLEEWRELVIHADSLLGWDKDWYPAVTAAILTLKFISIWYWDPTLLTFIGIAGALLTLVDFVGPKVMAKVFKPENWTGEKEQKFDSICEEIVSALRALQDGIRFCQEAKEKKPVIHFVGTVGVLFILAWIGGQVNNFFLLYLTTMLIFMLPGLHRRGLLKKYFSQITLKLAEAVKGKDHLKKAE